MDFTSAFKMETKAGKGMKKKKKPVLTSQNGVGEDNDEQPRDATDDVNKDLEDEFFLPNDYD